jgi:choline dehydrogenase-like flavoprotein
VKDPLNHPLLMNNLITVHPLGGCPMGGEAATGVVTARLRRGCR